LFKDSFGRCDLPLGDESHLFESRKGKLLVLPKITKVYRGHGVPTTIGDERKNF